MVSLHLCLQSGEKLRVPQRDGERRLEKQRWRKYFQPTQQFPQQYKYDQVDKNDTKKPSFRTIPLLSVTASSQVIVTERTTRCNFSL